MRIIKLKVVMMISGLQDTATFEDRMEALRYGWMGKKRESGELQFQTLQKADGSGNLGGRRWQKQSMLRAMESALDWDQEVLIKARPSNST